MGKARTARVIVRALGAPAQAGRGLTTVGRTGTIGARGRNGVSWVRRATGTTALPGGTTLSNKLRRGIPWLIGGEVAWEFGRQLWDGLENGKLYDEEGSLIGSVADGCLNISEIMTDTAQLRTLISDLNDLRRARSDEDFENSQFAKTCGESDKPYSLTEEGLVLVISYLQRRSSIGTDFLFDPATLSATYFNDIYLSCFDSGTGRFIEPQETSWEGLRETLNELCDGRVDDSLVADGFRQLLDLDGWLKLTEMIERLKYQGRPSGGDERSGNFLRSPAAVGVYEPVAPEVPSSRPLDASDGFMSSDLSGLDLL